MFAAIPNQISAALQTQLAARLDLDAAFNAKALGVVSRVAELNLQMMHDTLARAADAPFAPTWATPGPPPADVDQVLAYGRQLTHIAFDAGTDCLRLLQPSLANGFDGTAHSIAPQAAKSGTHAAR